MAPFIDNIEELQIENSSLCPAACPQCDRELGPADKTWFEQKYLSTEFFDTKIPDYVYANLRNITFSGIMGDPCAAPNFIDVISTLRPKGPFELYIHTNGGMKNPDWWRELASKLGPNDIVQFGIDGLEDTNHIYRVNINWNKLINNVKAFIDAGGNANWQYIAFKHNEHQIEEAKELARELGFKNFTVKQSARFSLDHLLNKNRFGSGVLIEPPIRPDLKNEVLLRDLTTDIDEWFSRSSNTNITCMARQTKTVYINSDGQLMPCYFVGAYKNFRKHTSLPDNWNDLISEENNNISLYNNSWEDIISGTFFKKIADSWEADYKNGRLFVCAGNCSSFNGSLNNMPELLNFANWFNTFKNEEQND